MGVEDEVKVTSSFYFGNVIMELLWELRRMIGISVGLTGHHTNLY